MANPLKCRTVIFLTLNKIRDLMTSYIKYLSIILIIGFFCGCSSQIQSEEGNVSVVITDNNGKALPHYGLQVIDVNDGWSGSPLKSIQGEAGNPASVYLPLEEPVILKFIAPGHHPKFTFLNPNFGSIDFKVSLKSFFMPDDPSPVVVGNFNNFNSSTGIEMQQRSDGVWISEIETELDTIYYVIDLYSSSAPPGTEGKLLSPPGTKGKIVIDEEAMGLERAFLAEIERPQHESIISIEFDTSQYVFGVTDSELNILSETPSDIAGISKVYTRMTNEHMNLLYASVKHQLSGDDGIYEHDFSEFLSDMEHYKKEFNSPDISNAVDMATFRFYQFIGLTETEASSLLNQLSPDSPIWMFHFTALSDAVSLAGLKNYIQTLEEIVERSPFNALRGEALYNLVRYHYQEENEEEWYSTFFELVSNYPDHFRTNFAYQNYAPEQPIVEGKALPYNEFNLLEGQESINLHDIEESYLLVDFWATWCAPCITAMPKLHDLNEQFKDSDFAIVSISVDDDQNRVHSFRDEWEMPWYHGHQRQSSQVIREMGIVGVPHYILLGPDRTVLSNDQSKLRGEELSNIIDNYLSNN